MAVRHKVIAATALFGVLPSDPDLLLWVLRLRGGMGAPDPHAAWLLAQGENPHVVPLQYPDVQPLSAMAQLGRKIFYDASLSGSGTLSCASCHSPANAYTPANTLAMQLGGSDMHHAGVRTVPSLTYLYRQQSFSIGPDNPVNESINLQQLAALSAHQQRAQKSAQKTALAATSVVPQGGMFWDGRVNTLQQQAEGPLFNPLEMDAGSPTTVLNKLQHAPYAQDFYRLFGAGLFRQPDLALSEAMFAIARFQIEDPSFHPFSSKFDAWLQGRARFTPTELRGYLAFNDPQKGNCAACHLDQPTREGLPPLLTDTQYEALGVPRNPEIPANRDAAYFDMGLCGPYRTDLRQQTQYCGMFLTPSLRNVAQHHAYFHNGVYHSLEQVLDFYALRDTEPQKIYPVRPGGRVAQYNDLPARYSSNVDVADAPFNHRKAGDAPAISVEDRKDIIAFLHTLTDGYSPDKR